MVGDPTDLLTFIASFCVGIFCMYLIHLGNTHTQPPPRATPFEQVGHRIQAKILEL